MQTIVENMLPKDDLLVKLGCLNVINMGFVCYILCCSAGLNEKTSSALAKNMIGQCAARFRL